MSYSSSREIGKEFLEAFISEVIQNVKIESILFDKDRLLRAVKQIEFDTFEISPSFSDLKDKEENTEVSYTEPIALLDIPLDIDHTPQAQLAPQPLTLQQSSSQSSSSLRDLLASSSGKSLLDITLPKVNKQLMIRRHLQRDPSKRFNMPVPKLPIPRQTPLQKKPESKSKEIHPSPSALITIIALGKINNLLLDPTVQTIECPGPGKQITVYRSGFIQNANVFLTTDEINKIMLEISIKTKIPIIPGVFKAALSNFIITSVISEFVGTRFIIQKKESSDRD